MRFPLLLLAIGVPALLVGFSIALLLVILAAWCLMLNAIELVVQLVWNRRHERRLRLRWRWNRRRDERRARAVLPDRRRGIVALPSSPVPRRVASSQRPSRNGRVHIGSHIHERREASQ